MNRKKLKMLKWSDCTPFEPGYYYLRKKDDHKVYIVEIFKPLVLEELVFYDINDVDRKISKLKSEKGGLWVGPIQVPE